MKFKITWINIGRNKFNQEIIKEFPDLYSAQEFAYKIADQHLYSSDTSLDATKEKNLYYVYAGFRHVGDVKIEEQEQ